MSITQPEIQQALRISRAIEEHLEQIRSVNVPSQELYPMLADRELVAVSYTHLTLPTSDLV